MSPETATRLEREEARPSRPGPDEVSTAPVVDVVIVSYHSAAYVHACLDSLDAQTGPVLNLIVIDNDSADGIIDSLSERDDAVHAETMGYNAGFARATNRGIAAGSARYVLLLNPDTRVEPTALARLVEFAGHHPGAGVVAPRLVNADGSEQHTARAFPTASAGIFGRRSPITRLLPNNRWSSRFLTGRDHVGDEAFEIDWVSGACMLVPRAVIDAVGGLDENFFLFWEDADWCKRIKDAGFEVWCVPTAVVVHDEGGTRGHGWPAPVVRHFHAGAYRYWIKHHAPQPWNPARWLAAALLSTRAALILTRNRLLASPTTRNAR